MKPKSLQSAARLSLGALSIGILAACGGGGGGGLGVADGGIRGTGSSVGPVSGFGSVFVNGVRFEIQGVNQPVQSNDGVSFESDLDEGMILRIDGSWRVDGEGTANRVEYDDSLRGEIEVLEPWNTTTKSAKLRIYGLVVNLDAQTVVKGKPVAGLVSGDFVRVSAWRLPSGEFRASLVRVRDDANSEVFDAENEVEIEGAISNLNRSLRTFEIGTVTVEYDTASTNFDNVDIAEVGDGDFVEVEGSFNGSVLFARDISEDDLRRYRQGEEGDIETSGPVTSTFDSATRLFEINGLSVRVTEDTEFEDGLTENDLVPELLIQVEGEFQGDGTVLAEEIQLREGESEVEGRVSANSVNPNDRSFRIGGVLVTVSPLTAIVGEDNVRLKLEDLGGSQKVEVTGVERIAAGGNVFLEAFKVEVDDEPADDDFQLVGRLRGIQGNVFDVLGIPIETNTGTVFNGTNRNELQERVDQGQQPLIEVKYDLVDNRFSASEIELDEDDG